MAEVIMPKMGDAMTEGTLLQWIKPNGTTVKYGDVIAEIETDKSNVEVEAEEGGILSIHIEAGAIVAVGTVIATIGDKLEKSNIARPAAKPDGQIVASAGTVQAKSSDANAWKSMKPVTNQSLIPNGIINERLKASPLARRVAREKEVDIARVSGSGPFGRIVEADVRAYVASAGSSVRPQGQSARGPAQPSETSIATTATELTAIRKVIAKRMVESKTTIPHFYITAEVDMVEALALREKLNTYDTRLNKISLNDMVVKASAKALAKNRGVNASYRDDKIVHSDGIHVGIAVALNDGLIVPVVRDADVTSLRKLSEKSRELITKARDKKLKPNEYSGGSFTVSNLGSFDVENFIAIIDPSQGAILLYRA